MSLAKGSAEGGSALEDPLEPLPSPIEMAIERAVANAMRQFEERLGKAENDWKSDASGMLGNIAKNRRYVEDFVAKQGDYVAKLNSFAEDFRMELDSKFQKGNAAKRSVNEVMGDQDLPSDYYWRLERIEKQVGTHRYLEKNKEARSVNERLTALENATGILAGADAYIDNNSWGNLQSVPVSNLRVFSREVGSARGGRPLRPHNGWDNQSRSILPAGPRSSSARVRPVTHGGDFPPLTRAEENQSPSQRNTSTAPASHGHGHGHIEGEDDEHQAEKQDALPTAVPANAPLGSAAQFVAATLQDMNVLMKIERDSKSDLQNQLAELTFELDQKRLADEEMRIKVEELAVVNREARIKEALLEEQKERIAGTLSEMQRQLREMEDRAEREREAAVRSSLDSHPDVLALKTRVHDMEHELKSTKHNNSEYERSIKDLMKFTKEVEAKRLAALEEKKYMEALLKEARQQLIDLQTRTKPAEQPAQPEAPAPAAAADAATAPEPASVEVTAPAAAEETQASEESAREVADSPSQVVASKQPAARSPSPPRVEMSYSDVSDSAPSPDARAKTAPGPNRPNSSNQNKASPNRPTSAEASSDNAKRGSGSAASPSGIPQTVAELKKELQKEEVFLNQVNSLRGKVKEDINAWLVNFKNENGRDATAADKEVIASKFKAYKEASQLKENASARIKAIKARYKELKADFEKQNSSKT